MNRHRPTPTEEENHHLVVATSSDDGGDDHEHNNRSNNRTLWLWAQLLLFLGVVVVLRCLSTTDPAILQGGNDENQHVTSGAQLLTFLVIVGVIHRFGPKNNNEQQQGDVVVEAKKDKDTVENNNHQMEWAQLGLFLGVVLTLGILSNSSMTNDTTLVINVSDVLKTMSSNSHTFDIGPKATFLVDFKGEQEQGGDNNVVIVNNLGPHKASLFVEKSCKDPAFGVRWQGDALVGIKLQEESNQQVWSGTFYFPFEGNYKLEAYWYGCGGQDPKTVQLDLDSGSSIHVKGLSSSSSSTTVMMAETNANTSLYPNSAWVSSQKLSLSDDNNDNDVKGQPYIWFDPKVPTEKATLFHLKETIVAKEGTVGEEHGTYQFGKLSNYELVCWFGSESAEQLRASFLELRPLVWSGQRPFKFHYYPTKHLVRPDRDWDDHKAQAFRKCKHILVSMDEMESDDDSSQLSQMEYQSQVETLLSHLQKAFPDETFPIWMLTVNDPPFQATSTSTTTTKKCHTPTLPRTSDHPCNDALRDLFAKGSLQSRVQLLDNTDLTLPQLGENKKDTMAVIAMRIFVFVGKRVEEWRAAGQSGFVGGLKRGEVVEPNFELIRYNEWH
jgi:hypothetical protein